jgi:formate dehydrogenase maturation protein FdhE
LIQLAGEVLQQLAAVQAGLPPVQGIDDNEVEARLAAGQAIVDQVPIPVSIFQNTLSHLLELFRHFELMPPLSAARLQYLLTLPPHAWLDETSVAASCQDQDLPAGLFLFLGRKALFPFYHEAATAFLEKSFLAGWQKGKCPFCGQEPTLASFAPDSGQRFLYCSLCGIQWPFPRQTCVFCGNQESHFSYIFIEDDPARRADLCRACRRYLKTIVTSRLTYALYLPLEEFVTIDLDALLLGDDLIK